MTNSLGIRDTEERAQIFRVQRREPGTTQILTPTAGGGTRNCRAPSKAPREPLSAWVPSPRVAAYGMSPLQLASFAQRRTLRACPPGAAEAGPLLAGERHTKGTSVRSPAVGSGDRARRADADEEERPVLPASGQRSFPLARPQCRWLPRLPPLPSGDPRSAAERSRD